MTKTEIKEFVKSLLDDYEMSDTLFDTFLNMAQSYWENQRPWMILRKEDATQSIGNGNTFETQKDLPTDFRKWYTRFPIALTDSASNIQQYLREIPLNMKLTYKGFLDRFYCDYKNKKFYVCGDPGQSLTARIYYIMKLTLVSAADSNEWDFPTEFHPILGLTIAVYHKLGVDYDIINGKQAENNASTALQIFRAMEDWDGDLQESAIQGQDYGTSGEWRGHSGGGRIPPDLL